MIRFYKRRYLFVFLATTVIFSLGLLLGMLVNEKKLTLIEDSSEENMLNSLSLQLQFLYLSDTPAGNESCPVLISALDHSWDVLARTYQDFIKYKESPEANRERVKALERSNILNDIRYWLLLKKARQYCTLNPSVSALFFFSDTDCMHCEDQSVVLEYFKRLFGDRFLLFHLNTDIPEPLVTILKSRYGIQKNPVLILEDEILQGYRSSDELLPLICSKFSLPQPECE